MSYVDVGAGCPFADCIVWLDTPMHRGAPPPTTRTFSISVGTLGEADHVRRMLSDMLGTSTVIP